MDKVIMFSRHIGIDVSKKKCDYCVLDNGGNVLERGQYANTINDAKAFAQEMARKYRNIGCQAACESTANMWKTTYAAVEATGIRIKLANPFKRALITKSAKKTDKEDARKIAELLRVNMIQESHVPTPKIRGIKTMIRYHVKLTQERTRTSNRIHSMLDAYNVTIQATNLYSRKGIKQLEETELGTPQDTFVLRQNAKQLQHQNELLADTDANLEREAAHNLDVRLLVSMPGVGLFTALLLAMEIDGITRFKNPKKLVSMAGLCPSISESGTKSNMSRIKKQNTNKLLNWAMCEAAQIAVMHDPKMKAFYESVKKRHADKHALGIVAVANKMITIMWHILMTGKPYESRNEDMYQRKLNRLKKAHNRKM